MKRLDELKTERSEVDIFKLGKRGLFMDKIHRFTRRSVAKFVYANVLLIAILIRLDLEKIRFYRGWLSGEFGDTLHLFLHFKTSAKNLRA